MFVWVAKLALGKKLDVLFLLINIDWRSVIEFLKCIEIYHVCAHDIQSSSEILLLPIFQVELLAFCNEELDQATNWLVAVLTLEELFQLTPKVLVIVNFLIKQFPNRFESILVPDSAAKY